MSLIEYDLLRGKIDKVKMAIERFKNFEPKEGYYLAFSGGKDSVTIKALADMAGVKYDAHYSVTTVDPPELVHFIKRNHPDVIRHSPKLSMWKLIPKKKMPPTRMVRYCCEVLKEGGGDNRVCVTGIRWAESNKRSKRRMTEQCQKKSANKVFLHPIIDWTDSDVWEFIKMNKIPYCKLYDEGFKRLGCILCPMQTKKNKIRDIEKYPKYYNAYLRAFENMLIELNKGEKKPDWKTAKDVMDWWINEPPKGDPDQTVLFE